MNNTAENIKQNLLQTKSYFVDNNLPNNEFIEMIDYAIQYWETDQRLMALALLADKEQELIANGTIVDAERGTNESGYFVELYDYLSKQEDKELGFVSLGELGRASRQERQKKRQERKDKRKDRREERKENRQERKEDRKEKRQDRKEKREERKEDRKEKRQDRKENRQERKEDRKENGDKRLHNVNKFNPAMVVMRNAFRGLIALNMFGFATIFNSQKAKDKGVYDKVINNYYNLGGEKDKIDGAIKAGSKKKPIFNKKIRQQLDSGKLSGISGFEGLGEPATIATLIASATAPILSAWKWIKEAGLDKVIEEIPNVIPDRKPDPDGNARDDPDNTEQPDNSNEYQPDNTNEYQENRNISNSPDQLPIVDEDKSNNKKIIIFGSIAVGIIGIAGASYYFYNKTKKETLTGITYNY